MITSDDWKREEDPEVVADAALRSSSQFDVTRTRHAVNALGGQSVTIVAQWKCAGAGCPDLVGVTEDAVHALSVMNAQLERKGETPIAGGALCPRHSDMRSAGFAQQRADCQEALPRLIRELKDAAYPAGETALIAKLRRAGHPDVDGLLAALVPQKRKGRL